MRGWSERIRIRGDEADFERAVAAVRRAAERSGATQFEALTAAAFAAFAEAEVDVAVVEAGLGGRHDATNVLDTRVVVLTSVALDQQQAEAAAASTTAATARRAGTGVASTPRTRRHTACRPASRAHRSEQ